MNQQVMMEMMAEEMDWLEVEAVAQQLWGPRVGDKVNCLMAIDGHFNAQFLAEVVAVTGGLMRVRHIGAGVEREWPHTGQLVDGRVTMWVETRSGLPIE